MIFLEVSFTFGNKWHWRSVPAECLVLTHAEQAPFELVEDHLGHQVGNKRVSGQRI